jgi:hypothetical protein
MQTEHMGTQEGLERSLGAQGRSSTFIRRGHCCAALTLCLTAIAPAAGAQTRDTLYVHPPHADSVQALAARLARASLLRIVTREGKTVVREPRVIPVGLMYRWESGVQLPREVGGTLQMELAVQRRSTGRGALIGGLLGAVAGAALGAAFSGLACLDVVERACSPPALQGALVVGAIGGAGGALIGAGIGRLIPHWETVYRGR